MNTKVLLAALAGSVVTFFTGYLIWGMALQGFMDSNMTDAARSVSRGENIVMWAIFVGCLSWSLLLAMVFSRWAGINTFKSGAMGGFWVFLLVGLGTDFFMYGGMDVWKLNALFVDVLANAVQGAIGGGVIGWVLGYGNAK